MRASKSRAAARSLEAEEIRAVTRDGRAWCKLGVVKAADGQPSHFEKVTDASGNTVDVLVDVKVAHTGETLACRLGSNAGRLDGYGIWCIPPEGTEVAIIIPEGELEAGPIIVATLSSGGVPDSLDATTLVIKHSAKVRVEADSDVVIKSGGTVYLGDDSGTQPVPRGDDLETRLSNLETAHNTHKHTCPAGTTSVPDIVVGPTYVDFKSSKVKTA